ncbi:PAS domain-containing protein [Fulvivirgaceae bacterium PWU4]|uniref:PAS domain-containing protein n=1 Tax=Chryseosolibacter histidini TaxID=2782349 RepID=A0AAP2DP39_9BACT|nr:PAS domain-containing protein [Chryseosolibacter histidini]MBT1697679.1 PAS domain-containing protein [Chryseosolibacter histidini]
MKKSVCEQCSSEAMEFQEQAKRSDQIMRAICDSTQSFIILISLDFRIIFFNKRALHFSKLQYGKDLQVGDSFMSYQRDGEEAVFMTFQDNFSQAIASGCPVTTEREMRYHNLTVWIRTEYTPVYDKGKVIGVALRIVDISERKKKELQIEKQNEQLRQISWIQSHKTRQPIATILGLVHILDKTSLTEDNRKIIAMLEKTVTQLDMVIRDTVIRANSV